MKQFCGCVGGAVVHFTSISLPPASQTAFTFTQLVKLILPQGHGVVGSDNEMMGGRHFNSNKVVQKCASGKYP